MNTLLASTLALVLTTSHDDGQVLDPAFDGFADRWRTAMDELGVPGMAMVVVEGEDVLHLQTFGLRDVERDLPVTPDTMFYIASATKPFVAMATMQLAEEGKLGLDDPVKKHLPRFQLADEELTETITVRDLLCHSQGINSFPVVFLDAYTGQITEDRYYHFLKDAQPLGRLDYTNVHFTLAGRILEAHERKSWKDVLEERIFTPAGMEHTTGYATWMYAQPDVALPTARTGDGFTPTSVRKIDETMHAAGGLGTSIRDGARWIEVQLNGGVVDDERLLSEEGLEEMLAPQSTLPQPDGWLRKMEGFGLGWSRGTYRGHRYFQHGGGYVGSASVFTFLPDLGIGVVVLANSSGSGHALCDLVTIDVYDFLLGDDSGYDHLAALRERESGRGTEDGGPTGANPALAEAGLSLEPAAYVGEYASEHWGELVIELTDGGLHGRIGNVRLSLHTRGEDRVLASASGALESEGAFEVTGDVVASVTLDINGYAIVFARR